MPTDEQLVQKTVTLRAEQDRWNDLFATKLIELLDKIDSVRSQVLADHRTNQKQTLLTEELATLVERASTLSQELEQSKNRFESREKEYEELASVARSARDEATLIKAQASSAVSAYQKASSSLSLQIARVEKVEQLQVAVTNEARRVEAEARRIEAEARKAEELRNEASASLRKAEDEMERARSSHDVTDAQLKVFGTMLRRLAICMIVSALLCVVAWQLSAYHQNWQWLRWLSVVVEVLPILVALRIFAEVSHER